MANLTVVQIRPSGLIVNPNHGLVRRSAKAASASKMPSATAMPPMADHDKIGGIHGEPGRDGVSDRHEQRDPAEPEHGALDDIGSDRIGLEPDADCAERAFDARAVGQENKRADIEGNAGLEEQRDDGEQDSVAEGVTENGHDGSA